MCRRCREHVPVSSRPFRHGSGAAQDAGMEDELMMAALVVIGLAALGTSVVGIGLPSSQRLSVLLPLIGGAGAGVSSLAIAIVVIPDTAADATYAAGFLVSSLVGATVVGLTLRRLVGRVRES
jgi:hypothetical protein